MKSVKRLVIEYSYSVQYISIGDYQDCLTITKDTIAYNYQNRLSDGSLERCKWQYKTNSPIFRNQYDVIVDRFLHDPYEGQLFFFNTHGMKITVTYDDNTEYSNWLPVNCGFYKSMLSEITMLVPKTEILPVILRAATDYPIDSSFEQ